MEKNLVFVHLELTRCLKACLQFQVCSRTFALKRVGDEGGDNLFIAALLAGNAHNSPRIDEQYI